MTGDVRIVKAEDGGAFIRPLRMHLTLATSPADGCTGQQALENAIESRLGRHLFAARAHADFFLEVALRPSESGEPEKVRWTATIGMRDGDGRELGSRTLDGPEVGCRSVDELLVLSIALAVDTTITELAARKPEPGAAGFGFVGGAVRGAVGEVPGSTPGLAAAGLIPIFPWLTTHLSIGAWLPREQSHAGVGARIAAFDASAELCPRLIRRTSWQLLGCVGGQAGLWHAAGVGLDVSESNWSPSAQAQGGVRFVRRWRGFAWGLGAVGGDGVARNRAVYRDSGGNMATAYQTPRLAARVEMSLGWAFQ